MSGNFGSDRWQRRWKCWNTTGLVWRRKGASVVCKSALPLTVGWAAALLAAIGIEPDARLSLGHAHLSHLAATSQAGPNSSGRELCRPAGRYGTRSRRYGHNSKDRQRASHRAIDERRAVSGQAPQSIERREVGVSCRSGRTSRPPRSRETPQKRQFRPRERERYPFSRGRYPHLVRCGCGSAAR